MKSLFMAHVTIWVSEYMGDSTIEIADRLVWANDEDEARSLLTEEYTHEDQYGTNRIVDSIELSISLGNPLT